MHKRATFQFLGSVTAFFRGSSEQITVPYTFKENPSIKDAIEALGVPHPEVHAIFCNGSPIVFTDSLPDLADIRVYGLPLKKISENALLLQGPAPEPVKFIADGHLGKLARRLRWLGFDTLCETFADDQELIRLALLDDRIILTRDLLLLKFKVVQHGYWLRSQNPKEQLAEVVERYNLLPHIMPFSRCSVCNGLLREVPKPDVEVVLEPKTRQFFNRFFRCESCLKVYWQGSHFDKIKLEIDRLKGN